MPEPQVDLACQPAVAMFLIVAVVAALITTVINLRDVRLWLLRATGQRVTGVVTRIEMVTDSGGAVLRRPLVAFTIGGGAPSIGGGQVGSGVRV